MNLAHFQYTLTSMYKLMACIHTQDERLMVNVTTSAQY